MTTWWPTAHNLLITWWQLADHLLTTCNVCLERVETLCIGNIYIRLYQYCWQLFWKFLKETLIHPQSAHTLTDKSKRRRHARRTLNFLILVCCIVCKCSIFQQDTTCLHKYKCVWLFYNVIGAVAQCPYKWGVGSAFHCMKIHICHQFRFSLCYPKGTH